MTSNLSRHSMRFAVAIIAAAMLMAIGVPAQADKGFDATCGEVEYRLGSGTGLSSAKKDLDQTRGRWGTAARDNSGAEKTSSGGSLIPVSWTLTLVDSVTDETLLTDEPLLSSHGHRNQDTIVCTFTSVLPASPPMFPNAGNATHTITVVFRPVS
jgi:hypothetical protein